MVPFVTPATTVNTGQAKPLQTDVEVALVMVNNVVETATALVPTATMTLVPAVGRGATGVVTVVEALGVTLRLVLAVIATDGRIEVA